MNQIFVKTLNGSTITLSVDLNMTTDDFKKLVFKIINVDPIPICRFSYSGKYLNDGHTLSDLNISEACTVLMSVPFISADKKITGCLDGNESLLRGEERHLEAGASSDGPLRGEERHLEAGASSDGPLRGEAGASSDGPLIN
jgi:hypothetical protein